MRPVAVVRTAWGCVLVTAPGAVLTGVTGRPSDPAQRHVLRALGVRHLLQAGAVTARPTRRGVRLGAAVDLAHALTCVAAVLVLPSWRRPAALDAVGATAFATIGLLDARR